MLAAAHRTATRDREATRRRILAAVGEVLAESGFRALGINAIAKRAGVDKVLIYRYFGGLPELLAAYAEDGDFWWREEEMIGADLPAPPRDEPAAWLGLLFRRHVAAMRARPVTIEIMGWEAIERNELTAALSDVREHRSLAVMKFVAARFPGAFADSDIAALVALFGAAVNYLLIRARTVSQFQGVDLSAESGWERLFAAIESAGAGMLRG